MIKEKKATSGVNIFIKKRNEPAQARDIVSLRSLTKAFGIISPKRNTIAVVITVVRAVIASLSMLPNLPALSSRNISTVAIDEAAIFDMLLPIRIVVMASSKLLTIYRAFLAFLSPSSARFFMRILFMAEKALSVPAKYAQKTTNVIKASINRQLPSPSI